ncbi:hypothetical protein CSUB01_00005 [Colletotrichum sublineola]|uniref:Uncharacterized protein n=1 Tax=Colletotrichum sublineola TaxID=1173701 RepID=A0A066XTX3_COLSU|nr:hypothetical protein CSUB01_00005 [Colletotrichum sublineola]
MPAAANPQPLGHLRLQSQDDLLRTTMYRRRYTYPMLALTELTAVFPASCLRSVNQGQDNRNMSLTISNRFVGHQGSLGGSAFRPFPPPHHGSSLMHRQQWPARNPVQVQPQNRDSTASTIPLYSIRHSTGPPRFSKPADAASVTSSASRESNPDFENRDQDAEDSRFSTPASGQSTGIINPFDLSATAPSEPRHVLVRVDGDAGAYLSNVTGRPVPTELSLPTEMDGSRSVTSGDQIQTGWSVDYYGLSRTPREYGNGIGWRSQETEAVADAQGNFGWPRKYVCSMCSLHWKAMPLPAKVIRGDVSQRDRIDLRIVCARPHAPASTAYDGTLTRTSQTRPTPGGTQHFPGLAAQSCIIISIMKGPAMSHTRREMKAHLHSPRKNGHRSYLTGLASRIEHGQPLSAIDQEICSRLMLMFNDRDARGQKSISQPINTVLGPEDVSSPAILREHTQWLSYLGLHTPEVHRRDFFDPRTNQWYYREYNLDEDFENACENVRIVSYATGRPAKASDFLWH